MPRLEELTLSGHSLHSRLWDLLDGQVFTFSSIKVLKLDLADLAQSELQRLLRSLECVEIVDLNVTRMCRQGSFERVVWPKTEGVAHLRNNPENFEIVSLISLY